MAATTAPTPDEGLAEIGTLAATVQEEKLEEPFHHREQRGDDDDGDDDDPGALEQGAGNTHDADPDDAAPDQGADAVEGNRPDPFADRERQGFLLHPEEVFLGSPHDPALSLGPEVGDFQPVAEDVVTVETHQRVCVEQHRHHRGGEHDVVAEGVDESRRRVHPDEDGDRADEQLDVHPGGGDADPRPAGGKSPGRAGIDVSQRSDQGKHADAPLRNGRAEALGDDTVPELVDQLQRGEGDDQEQPVGRENGGAGGLGQFAPVGGDLDPGPDQDQHPDDHRKRRAGPVEPRADKPEKGIGIAQRNFQEEHFLDDLLGFLLLLIGRMLEPPFVLTGALGFQQFVIDRPAQQALGLAFVEGFPSHRPRAGGKGFAERPGAIEGLEKAKLGGSDLEIFPGGNVLEDVTGTAGRFVKRETQFLPQPRTDGRQLRHRVVGADR